MTQDIRVLDELGVELERAVREPTRRVRRLRAGRLDGGRFGGGRLGGAGWRAPILIAALCLGGATVALAAAGVFRTGSPVPANVPQTPRANAGVVNRHSVSLLSLAVSDPQGGPPWGLRMQHTTRGLTCLQYGRLDHGTIGILGIDHAFGDDGLFHPLSVSYQDFLSCATTDARGHAFIDLALREVSASGSPGSCHGVAASLFVGLPTRGPIDLARRERERAERDPRPVCSPAQLRDILYGLLGPDAVSVTYPGPHGQPVTERTAGPDGAYLVLAPATDGLCAAGGDCGGGSGGGSDFETGLTPGFITSVSYRGGYVCRIAQLGQAQARVLAQANAALAARFPAIGAVMRQAHPTPRTVAAARADFRSRAYRAFAFAHRHAQATPSCPLRGYAAPDLPRVTPAQLATPITLRVGKVTNDCPGGPGGRCGWPVVPYVITFRARVAVTNIDSHYEITTSFTPNGPCANGAAAGNFGPTRGDLRAGQSVRYSGHVSDCPGVIDGEVLYTANDGPSTEVTVPHTPGQSSGVLVGRFSFRIR